MEGGSACAWCAVGEEKKRENDGTATTQCAACTHTDRLFHECCGEHHVRMASACIPLVDVVLKHQSGTKAWLVVGFMLVRIVWVQRVCHVGRNEEAVGNGSLHRPLCATGKGPGHSLDGVEHHWATRACVDSFVFSAGYVVVLECWVRCGLIHTAGGCAWHVHIVCMGRQRSTSVKPRSTPTTTTRTLCRAGTALLMVKQRNGSNAPLLCQCVRGRACVC